MLETTHSDTHVLEDFNPLHIHYKEQLINVTSANNHCLRIIWNTQLYCMGKKQNYIQDRVNMATISLQMVHQKCVASQ